MAGDPQGKHRDFLSAYHPHMARVLQCGGNSWIFRDAADQMLPVTEYSETDTVTEIKFSVIYY
jgi:hypothetical protein